MGLHEAGLCLPTPTPRVRVDCYVDTRAPSASVLTRACPVAPPTAPFQIRRASTRARRACLPHLGPRHHAATRR